MLRNLLKNNLFFLLPFLVLFLFLSWILFIHTKADIHLWINSFHTDFFDSFFKYVTHLGDGLFVIIPVVLLGFFSLRHAVYILTTYLSTGLITQFVKRFVFEDMVRPVNYFQDIAALHLVEGVKMLRAHSFPSGHAASAFALFIGLGLITENKWLKLGAFVLACLVAFSRIYLSQHFLIDVYAGALIGITGALSFFIVFYRNDRNWHQWTYKTLISRV